jgi:hypothetical protein
MLAWLLVATTAFAAAFSFGDPLFRLSIEIDNMKMTVPIMKVRARFRGLPTAIVVERQLVRVGVAGGCAGRQLRRNLAEVL